VRAENGASESEARDAAAEAVVLATDRSPVYAGRLEVRPGDHAALVDGRPLSLTVRELQLLTALAQNAERVMTRRELYSRVWQREYRKSDRSVDVYVGRLRTKLGRAMPGRRFIHTHTGIGYRFSPDG
jgi:DNA-binding response OmpR family regulator